MDNVSSRSLEITIRNNAFIEIRSSRSDHTYAVYRLEMLPGVAGAVHSLEQIKEFLSHADAKFMHALLSGKADVAEFKFDEKRQVVEVRTGTLDQAAKQGMQTSAGKVDNAFQEWYAHVDWSQQWLRSTPTKNLPGESALMKLTPMALSQGAQHTSLSSSDTRPAHVLLKEIYLQLDAPSKRIKCFKDLDLSIKKLMQKLNEEPLSFSAKKAILDPIYGEIREKFYAIVSEDSSLAWVQRADLLDALDQLTKLPKEYGYSPLEVRPDSTKKEVWNNATIPVVPYSNIQAVTQSLNQDETVMLDAKAVQQRLRQEVLGEYTSTSKVIRKISKRGFKLARVMGSMYKMATRIAGKYKEPIRFKKAVKKIANMSRSLGIKSFEVLYSKATDMEKGVFYYRGPKYLFGSSVHDYESVNEWFKRDLTPEARYAYLEKAREETGRLEESYGDLSSVATCAVSPADARLRFEELPAGDFGRSQELTGKVLSDEMVEDAKKKKDNATYYAEKYKFTTKNLLGRESDDSMQARELPDFTRLKEEGERLKIKVLPDNMQDRALQEARERELLAGQERFLQDPQHREVIGIAQRELLSGIYRAFNEEGAVQVIQRLAPADVHNYVAPLDGTPLSHKRAVELLQERLKAKQDKLEASGASQDQIDQIQAEIQHFEYLIEIFEAQESALGRSSLPTIGLLGTNESVSALAIQNQSRILAQNDRNVMLFEHPDGSFSLHVFIGATGVNKVDVDPSTAFKRQGDRQGDMQFGRDRYEAEGAFLAAERTTTRDSTNKLKIQAETRPVLKAGTKVGYFPPNGSTVISYYLPSDFTIKPEITAFQEKAKYGEGINRANIEILANMGDPLLIRTEILIAEALEKAYPEAFGLVSPILQLKDLQVALSSLPSSASSLMMQARHLLTTDESGLTNSQLRLKDNLITILDKRWEVLHGIPAEDFSKQAFAAELAALQEAEASA